MNCKLPLTILLMSLASFAQVTTTYTVTAQSSGVYGTPFRAFSIPLNNGAEVNWLEVGSNTACSGQTLPAVGFIFLTLPTGGALPCASLTGSPSPGQGSFEGLDNNGIWYSGTYSFSITKAYRCSGGRGGGGCHYVFTITGGEVTITR
jgi:hypothetical protein